MQEKELKKSAKELKKESHLKSELQVENGFLS